ncbi:MAG TPA: hypothetical protein VKE74_35780, partial [Gemmataceae bacterium]|nr:hypothetical protein [Gemmataceae bacterium]
MTHRGRANADELLAAALAAGKSHRDAAVAAGVSQRTAFRRMQDPAFKDRVREMRAAMMAAALGKLTDGMTAASDALNTLVADTDRDVRFKAAVKVIELAIKVKDTTDLEDRLSRVEQQLAGGTPDARDDGPPEEGRGDGEGPAGSPAPAAGCVPERPGPV